MNRNLWKVVGDGPWCKSWKRVVNRLGRPVAGRVAAYVTRPAMKRVGECVSLHVKHDVDERLLLEVTSHEALQGAETSQHQAPPHDH